MIYAWYRTDMDIFAALTERDWTPDFVLFPMLCGGLNAVIFTEH